MVYEDVTPDIVRKIVRSWKLLVYPCVALTILSSFYPSKSDLAWIAGGTAAASIASSDEAKELPDNLLKAANAFLAGLNEDEGDIE